MTVLSRETLTHWNAKVEYGCGVESETEFGLKLASEKS